MAWIKGQSGNPLGGKRDKPVRDMIRLVLKDAETAGTNRTLRSIVERILDKAAHGDLEAAKVVFERVEGKVPVPIAGDDDADPITVRTIITGVPRKTD
jgi:hypothetical protein